MHSVIQRHSLLPVGPRTAYGTWFEQADESLFVIGVSPKGKFLFEALNPAYELRTGLDRTGIVGRQLDECLPPDLADAAIRNYARCVQFAVPIRYEETCESSDGSRRQETCLTPVRDLNGRIGRIFGLTRDLKVDSQALAFKGRHSKHAEQALEAAHARHRAILESITDSYLTLDRDYRITDVNQYCLDWAGLTREEAIGLTFWDLCPPHHDCGVVTLKAMEERRTMHAELKSVLNSNRWLSYHVYPSPEGVSVFFRDITHRKETEQELKNIKGLLSATLNALSAHIAILNENGVIVAANESWRRFAADNGYIGPDHGVGQSYPDMCWAAADSESQFIRNELVAVLTGTRHKFDTEYMSGEGWFQLSVARFDHDGVAHVVVAHEDISERVATRQALLEQGERLIAAREEERRRIAAELHDSTAQQLVGAQLNLARMASAAHGVLDLGPLHQAENCIEEAQKEIRIFSYLLYPPSLSIHGLVATLSQYVKGFGERTNLDCALKVVGDADVAPANVQRSVLRIVQEALANVYRHAAAKRVKVGVRIVAGSLRVEVSDDGCGFRTGNRQCDTEVHAKGMGITGMYARAEQCGGRLQILRRRTGTTIRAVIPLRTDFG